MCLLVLGRGLAGTQGKGVIWAMGLALNRDHKIFDGRGVFFTIFTVGTAQRATRGGRVDFYVCHAPTHVPSSLHA